MAQNFNEFAHWEVAQKLVGSVCPHLSICKISSSGLHCVGCISHEQLRTQGDMISKSQKYLEYKAHDQQVCTRRNLHVTVKGSKKTTDVGSFSLSNYKFKLPRRVYLYPFASRIRQLLPTWVMLKTTRTFLPKGTQMGLKMSCTPKNPMVLLIIIPMKNGYFIGGIPHFQTYPNVGSCLGPVPGDCRSQSGPVPPGQHAKGAKGWSPRVTCVTCVASPLPKSIEITQKAATCHNTRHKTQPRWVCLKIGDSPQTSLF